MKVEIVVRKNPKKGGYFVKNKRGEERLVYEVTQEEMDQVFTKGTRIYGKRHAEADTL